MTGRQGKTCRGCIYFATDPSNLDQGSCHFNPPIAIPVPAREGGMLSIGLRPPVKGNDKACSQFSSAIAT
jgi:hypothetical protein